MLLSFFYVYSANLTIGEITGQILTHYINNTIKLSDITVIDRVTSRELSAELFLQNVETDEDILVYISEQVMVEKLEGLPIRHDKLVFLEPSPPNSYRTIG
jgi:hypothetical protein